jgi:drug/metabolite transporter (DMT)-like permease
MRANRSTFASRAKAVPFVLGAAGVICFSLTFPATALAERSFNPLTVGVGRSVVAAIAAIAILLGRRQPVLPPRAALGRLVIVAVTVGVGFGLLSAVALRQVGSVHVAVIAGLTPAATAGMAALRAGERPSRGYWAALALGLAAVIGFAVIQGGGRVRVADLLLIVAITGGGLGYAEGGALAREYGGWRVICWAVVLAIPVSLPVTVVATIASPPRHIGLAAVIGLLYLGLVSMCLGFFAWYQGMAKGGVAAIGRLQLAQPALTLGWSALLLGAQVGWVSLAAAAAVIAATAVGRNARVERRAPSPAATPTGAGTTAGTTTGAAAATAGPRAAGQVATATETGG